MAILIRLAKSPGVPAGKSRRAPQPDRWNVSVKRFLSIVAILALCSTASLAKAQSPTEYQVKAAFLYNFAKFIEWPARSFPTAGMPFTLCILGEDPFGPGLEEMAQGKTVHDRKLVTRRLKRVQDREPCHLLFISRSEEERLGDILRALKNSSVLTVGDVESFSQSGGIISFTMDGNKIRFDVNIDAADRAGLKISSRLLKLARIVKDGGK